MEVEEGEEEGEEEEVVEVERLIHGSKVSVKAKEARPRRQGWKETKRQTAKSVCRWRAEISLSQLHWLCALKGATPQGDCFITHQRLITNTDSE